MSQVINTNVASLNAQRNLMTSQTSLATSLQRLSSGLRINSAKDDAAGLAISDRFTTQIRGINQAIRNANDGISLAQVGEGALAEVTTNLQRIRELAVQSANATNSASDRLALDLEVQQRLAEIDRIASQTAFNGRKLLDGTFGNAAFQIGAEAGQSITLNLGANASTRLSAIGQIAQATTGALGAVGSGGTLAVTASNLNFGTAPSQASAGSTVFSLSGMNFGAVTDPGSNGTIQFTAAAFNFSSGSNTQTTSGVGDASLDFAANLAQFDVDGIGITLTTDYSGDADLDALALDIQTQLQAVDSNYTVTANGNDLVFTNVGSSAAVVVSNTDANAQAAGFANTAGTAGSTTPLAQFEIDGQAILLDGNYTDFDGLAAEIETQIQAYGGAFAAYTVTNNAGVITIDNGVNGGAAVAITNANASAVQAGIANNLVGTAGTAATADSSGTFTVDGDTITLDEDYGSFAAVQTAIQDQLDAYNDGEFTVAVDNAGLVTITRNSLGAGSTAPAVVETTGDPINGGIVTSNGQDAVATTNANFLVDGIAVTLNQDYADEAALRTAIGSQLGAGYTVGGTGSEIVITNNANGSAAVTISNADPNAFNAGFVNGAGTPGAVSGAIELVDLSINGTDVTGTFASVQELADRINTTVSGVFAAVSGNGLQLSSASDISLTGDTDLPTLGLGNTIAVNNGSLEGANVRSVADANAMIQRIDAALTTVSTFRSTFGAIQNRFESVTANLQTSVENLSASRSRILDADFAAETANLTRAQILQQAGVAMLAQANALPQNVLSLLR